MGLHNLITTKPVRVLGFVTAAHSLTYGIGFLTNYGGFDGALVGLQLNSFLVSGILGILLVIAGALLMFAFVRMNPKTIKLMSYIQGMLWFFVTLLYLINGAYLLALGIGLTWTIISLYISWAVNNRKAIMVYDDTEKAREDTRNEDTL